MATMRFIALWALFIACSYDIEAHPRACGDEDQCPRGMTCYRGFCVADTSTRDATVAQCKDGAPSESCYDGPPGTEGEGSCRAGRRFCVRGTLSDCFDQVMPSIEVCNGQDDDCNGQADDIAGRSCEVAIGQRCKLEGTFVCRGGAPSCELVAAVGTESCNGLDDDCDGSTDEGMSSTACFPEEDSGCHGDSASGFDCLGVCEAGRVSCTDEASTCAGAVVPAPEACTESGASLDEDCDGRLDEGCSCSEGTTRACYTGPAATIDRGPCRAGTQTCVNGAWSGCVQQILPQLESCANPGSDDDCDGMVDDVADLGRACIDDTKLGACRNGTLQCRSGVVMPVCVGTGPARELCDALDQDCDGNPTNSFDLSSNATCGACDISCSATELCCGGTCIERARFETDANHCGGCNRACGSGQYCCQGTCLDDRAASATTGTDLTECNCAMDCGPGACCGTRCVDLIKDRRNCGACGFECDPQQDCKGGACKETR
jgi:hypothetical protein